MTIPLWARERIAREVETYLARPAPHANRFLDHAARWLTAWPVYGGLGGSLLVSSGGEVYCWDDEEMEVRLEQDPIWRTLAWACAAELVPELRAVLSHET